MMKPFNLSKIKRLFVVGISLATTIFLSLQPVAACSWDYAIWQLRDKNADPLYRFIKGEKAGYIDRTGKIVVAPTLRFYGNYGGEFVDGLLLTGAGAGKYVDTSGKVVLETKYDRNWSFSEGLAVAMKESDGKWGYIDKTGSFIISPRFESYPNGYVYSFSDGLAMIKVKEKYGYIDRTGEFVIEPKFPHGKNFAEGFARVVVEGPCQFMDEGPCGEFQTVGEKVGAEKTPMCKFAFIDKTGALISDARFDFARDFSEGFAAIKLDGKWGFIDKSGTIVIKAQFDEVGSFSDGLAMIKQGGKWGFINPQGETAIAPQFDIAESFADGLAPVGRYDEKNTEYTDYYYINKQGKPAFTGKFARASHYFKGVAHVKVYDPNRENNYDYKGKYAYIDRSGKVIFTYKRKSDDD